MRVKTPLGGTESVALALRPLASHRLDDFKRPTRMQESRAAAGLSVGFIVHDTMSSDGGAGILILIALSWLILRCLTREACTSAEQQHPVLMGKLAESSSGFTAARRCTSFPYSVWWRRKGRQPARQFSENNPGSHPWRTDRRPSGPRCSMGTRTRSASQVPRQ